MAIVIFCQNMGGATFLVLANAIFSNSLRTQLQQRAAKIDVAPDVIVNAGVRSVRKLVSGNELSAVLQAYSNSVDNVMYLGIGVSIGVFVFLGILAGALYSFIRDRHTSEAYAAWRYVHPTDFATTLTNLLILPANADATNPNASAPPHRTNLSSLRAPPLLPSRPKEKQSKSAHMAMAPSLASLYL